MRKDHKPLFIHRLLKKLNAFYVKQHLRPQFDSLGSYTEIAKPRHCILFGKNIYAGNHLHIICAKHKPVTLSTWSSKQQQGEIHIGDYCLISPGVSIAASESIIIEDNCMLAAGVYIADSDWHGIYNRTRPFRCSAPVHIKNNAWIGYASIINKGITIGENSIVAAGSVVTHNVPDNTIVGGNPAAVIKTIDPEKRMIKREFLFQDSAFYTRNQKELDAYIRHQNSFFHWFRTLITPSKMD